MSRIDESAAVTATEHPQVLCKSSELDKWEFRFAKGVVDGLDKEWLVIVGENSFPENGTLYRINNTADSPIVDIFFIRIDCESRVVDFRLQSAQVDGASDVESLISDFNRKYPLRNVELAIHEIRLEMEKVLQSSSEGTQLIRLYGGTEPYPEFTV